MPLSNHDDERCMWSRDGFDLFFKCSSPFHFGGFDCINIKVSPPTFLVFWYSRIDSCQIPMASLMVKPKRSSQTHAMQSVSTCPREPSHLSSLSDPRESCTLTLLLSPRAGYKLFSPASFPSASSFGMPPYHSHPQAGDPNASCPRC